MFKSEFAKECSKSSDNLAEESSYDNVTNDDNIWLPHEMFREFLECKEQASDRVSSTSHLSLINSPMSKRLSSHFNNINRLQAAKMTRACSSVNIDKEREEMARLEVENFQLKKKLEMISKGDVMDSKYSQLATEVVRLQTSVNQMEQSKKFYENSTRQLVNILECLSSQLTNSNNCSTRHCPNDTNLDSDSFDSLLSRRSHDLSVRFSVDSYPAAVTAPVLTPTEPPLYENILFDSQHQGMTEDPGHLPPKPRTGNFGRSDSMSSVFMPAPAPARANSVLKDNVTARNRILMGSRSVSRALSNRVNSDHVKSFTALGGLSSPDSIDCKAREQETAKESRRYSYSRSKSVASGLPKLGEDQDMSLHNSSYETKSLLKRRKEDSGGLVKLFRHVKSFVGKDKLRKLRSSSETDTNTTLGSKLRLQHQSQTNLTPRKLKRVQHHSTPRLVKS